MLPVCSLVAPALAGRSMSTTPENLSANL